MVIVELNVYVNERAQEGDPKEWLSLRELWVKARYRIPFDRWVRYTLKNHGIQPRKLKQKTGRRGQPLINYYVPVDYSQELLDAVSRRKHIEIRLVRKQDTE